MRWIFLFFFFQAAVAQKEVHKFFLTKERGEEGDTVWKFVRTSENGRERKTFLSSPSSFHKHNFHCFFFFSSSLQIKKINSSHFFLRKNGCFFLVVKRDQRRSIAFHSYLSGMRWEWDERSEGAAAEKKLALLAIKMLIRQKNTIFLRKEKKKGFSFFLSRKIGDLTKNLKLFDLHPTIFLEGKKIILFSRQKLIPFILSCFKRNFSF